MHTRGVGIMAWSGGRPVLVQFLLELRHDLRVTTPTAQQTVIAC
jgi:hypothetical protein